MMPLPIANGFYKSDALPVSAQECVNWYVSMPDAPALSQEILFGTPGISQIATAGASGGYACRGGHRLNGTPYFVLGTSLFRLNSDHTLNEVGTIVGSGRVSMADNGTQLMILVPGSTGYIFTEGPDALSEITDTDFTANGNPLYVVFIDSYFVCTTDGNKFIISAVNDGKSWDALDFGSAESSPDGTTAPIVYKNDLFIGGTRTIEGFTNVTSGADFPFTRSGLFIDTGITAPFSIVNTPSGFFWLGAGEREGPVIWMMSGNQPQKISTQAIDQILERLNSSELSAIYGFGYSQAGHYFVGFTLPDSTVVYDLATQRWHERKSRITLNDGAIETVSWRVSAIVAAYGRLYAADSLDGRIGVLDIDEYQEYGTSVVRTFSTQPFHNNSSAFFVPALELTVESGVGNDDAPDPVIELAVSRDGGKTYSGGLARKIGKVGEYERRAIWRRLGRSARFDVYRFTLSQPVKPVVIKLEGDIRAA